MADIQSELSTGAIVGGAYEIVRALGVGGMGTVYEAIQLHLGRRVALKLLHARLASDHSVAKRFQREAKLAASLGHDNICEVTDFGVTDDGAPFLVMPLLKGQPLSDLLHGAGSLDALRVVDISCQVLSALAVAHDAHIVHRDLKPGNIFIVRLGDRADFVKLLDFGICKVKNQNSVNDLTRAGTVLGTPCYMAPEQARGARDIDHRVDIYAIGVILYEALTGRRPFDGESYNEIMFRILTEPFPLPRALRSEIPLDLERIILRSMARDPAERYQSAGEMRRALESAKLSTKPKQDFGFAAASTEPSIPMPFTPDSLPLSDSALTSSSSASHEASRDIASPAVKHQWLRRALWTGGVAAVTTAALSVIFMLEPTPKAAPMTLPAVPASAPLSVTPAQPSGKPLVPEPSSQRGETAPPSPAKEPEPTHQVSATTVVSEKKKQVSERDKHPKNAKPKAASPTSEKPDRVKGRFGASVVSDYGD